MVSFLAILFVLVGLPDAARADEALWELLQAGGQVAVIRHASTVPGFGDPPGFRPDDCSTQRNLSEAGREESRRIGAAFRKRGVPVERVLSSRWCRCLETARLAFGSAEPWPPLDSFFDDRSREPEQTRRVRMLIGGRPPSGNLISDPGAGRGRCLRTPRRSSPRRDLNADVISREDGTSDSCRVIIGIGNRWERNILHEKRGETMKGNSIYGMLFPLVLAAALVLPATAYPEAVHTRLDGFHEVSSVSTTGQGTFKAFIDRKARTVSYELSYADLEGDVLQSHIHFARPDTNGGIAVFLCTNLSNAPAGVPNPPPACPGPRSGIVSGIFAAGDVISTSGQGIAAGEFDELLDAIDAGATYVNVHTALFPGGELRGNLRGKTTPF